MMFTRINVTPDNPFSRPQTGGPFVDLRLSPTDIVSIPEASSYDRALGFHPAWREAEENKTLALARKAKIQDSGKDRADEQGDTEKPDDIVFDQKGDDKQGRPVELASGEMSDEEARATWLRRVQTTPADFLRAKFAYQAARAEQQPPIKGKQWDR